MKGHCEECQELRDLNPYIDSPHYKICFPCQMKLIKREEEVLKIISGKI